MNIGTVNLYTHGYDQYSRLNKVTTAAGVFNYTYLANSNLIASMTRPNNVPTNYTYETARDLLTKVANGSISTFQYANDAFGRRTSMNRSGSSFTAADVLSYTYNSYSELTGASSNNNASYSYNYTYDPIGNRKTAGLASTNWTYTANNLNQYTALNQAGTVQSPTYDADGNMLTRDGWTQTWNAENRLIKAEKGTAKLEFAYDYMGRRIEKKVYNGSTLTSHIRFVYDGYKLIEELNGLSNNAVLRRYVWQSVMFDSPLTVFDAAANKTYFYQTDANKNVTDLTDSAGAIVVHYEYSPFGQLVKSSGAYANTNVLTWSSEYADRETGLIYYNFREYDPKLGRWLSRDPIGHNNHVKNTLSFVNNNPISLTDKYGLLSWRFWEWFSEGDDESPQELLEITKSEDIITIEERLDAINCLGYACGRGHFVRPGYGQSLEQATQELGYDCTLTVEPCDPSSECENVMVLYIYKYEQNLGNRDPWSDPWFRYPDNDYHAIRGPTHSNPSWTYIPYAMLKTNPENYPHITPDPNDPDSFWKGKIPSRRYCCRSKKTTCECQSDE
ncbi:RHS repeat domain-containing protein [Victivallis sp. Marseille-Q1083]|uniref:RHS repeat domain-containing protein n=1 Tax=Victivallis sp. Marseille-Q1083 TaxID=2717288 RepID=UPI00158A9B1E|nr:RHS repeat-associated core domain-containing protein [Victivallis sp. Marseille-Q1083]